MKNLICLIFLFGCFFSNISSVKAQNIDSIVLARQLDTLFQTANDLANQKKHESALAILNENENAAIENYGKESLFYGKLCLLYGSIFIRTGRYSEAEARFLEALSNREIKKGKEYPYTLYLLGGLYGRMGKYKEAERLLLECKAIHDKNPELISADYSDTVGLLGNLYETLGQLDKAESLYLEMKNQFEKSFGKESEMYAGALKNLGALYSNTGQYEKAETFLTKAFSISEKVSGKEALNYGEKIFLLAELYLQMSNYQNAEPLFLEAKSIVEKKMGKMNPYYGDCMMQLGRIYFELGENRKAETHFLEANEIIAQVLGKEHINYAANLDNLGMLHINSGEYEVAEELFLESMLLRKKVLGEKHPATGRSLCLLGGLYRIIGKFEKAETFLTEAELITGESFGKEHTLYAEVLRESMLLQDNLGDYAKAATLYQKVAEIKKAQSVKAVRHLSEQELFKYISGFNGDQSLYYSFAHRQSELLGAVYDNALFHKGFLLNIVGEMNRFAQSDSEANDLFLRLKSYQRRLADEYTKSLADQNTLKLEEKANSIEKELARTVVGFGEAIRQFNWREVKDQLQPGEIAVEFVKYDFWNKVQTDSVMYAAAIVRSDSESPDFIPLFEEKSLENLLNFKNEKRSDNLKNLYAEKSIYNLIWKPLAKQLQNVQTIYFSPAGLLHRLNLGAITSEENQPISGQYNLVQVNSTRQLVLENASISRTNDATFFGGIKYDFDSLAMIEANTDFITENLISARKELEFSEADTTLRGGKWNFLKWTAVEAAANAQILNSAGFKTNLKSGYAATEEAFRQIGTSDKSPQIIHLATHGFFYPDPGETADSKRQTADGGRDDNGQRATGNSTPVFKKSEHPMIRSGLIMAGANRVWEGNPPAENMEDGILTAYEISQMDLSNTELVVLSACETGLGDIKGNEGVYGLQRAFKIAGAKHLMMSLWQVPDFQTQELMFAFYTNWLIEKMEIRAAFRAAQKEMRERYPNPFYWAGFVLIE